MSCGETGPWPHWEGGQDLNQWSSWLWPPALKQCLTAEKKGCLCWEPPTELFEDGHLLKFPPDFFTPFVNWLALNSQLCWWCLGGLSVLALQSSLFLCLLSQRILLNLWPLKMISGVEFLILITVWPRMSTFDDIFSNIHLRIFFLCLSCFSTSKFTSILDAENVKFWFPSSNPRELMVSFYKTGFFLLTWV